jgi:hypothetical protein
MTASAAGSIQASGGGGVTPLGATPSPSCFITVLLDDNHLQCISAFVKKNREKADRWDNSKDETEAAAADVMHTLDGML